MTSSTNNDTTSEKPDWYLHTLDEADGWAATRELLLEYTKIPEDKLADHVYKIRERAWNIFNYPCIGGFRFLDLSIGQAPHYQEILQRIKDGQQLLDLGCCFGQDERRLIADGAPSQNLHACDLRPEFPELGYDLFLDRPTLKTHFFTADIFDPTNPSLRALDNKIDILNTSSFFHLFPLDQQKTVARRATKLLRKTKGSLIVGRQVGNLVSGWQENRATNGGGPGVYRHNEESWRGMWEEVGRGMGVSWEVEVELRERPGWTGRGLEVEGVRVMRFSVRML